MDAAEIDERWVSFTTDYKYVEKEIYDELQETAHLFDTQDGTHAKWSPDGNLGLLLVFDPDEAEGLLAAFYAGMDGIDNAAECFSMWVGSFMGLLRQCVEHYDG